MPKDKFSVINELEENLEIDKDTLDLELIRQPELFYRVANLHERAKADRNAALAEMNNTTAELDEQFRAELLEEGGEKPKETEVRRKIMGSKRMQAANQAYLEASNRASLLAALQEAYEQKGHALRELANLYAANYFTVESGGKSRTQALEDAAKRGRQEAGAMRREHRKER